jgi:hypothetical protein
MRQVEQISVKNSHAIQQMLCIQEEITAKMDHLFQQPNSISICQTEDDICVIPARVLDTKENIENALDELIEELEVRTKESDKEVHSNVHSTDADADVDADADADVKEDVGTVKAIDIPQVKSRGRGSKKKTLDL